MTGTAPARGRSLGQTGEQATAPGGVRASAGVVHREAVMGTVVTFEVFTAAPAPELEAALERAVAWLHWVDDTFSTYKEASMVNRFDRGELQIGDCCPELRHIFSLCHRFNEETGGFFDAWASGHFDPSGVVKGWSIEEASRILVAAGLCDHSIDGGGDVRLRGAPGPGPPWRVGVRHPLVPRAYCADLSLDEAAVATSGTYERGLHVLDPFTGRPATDVVSVTIVGPDLTVADAYATAALAMGGRAPAWLDGLAGYEALVVSAEGGGWCSRGFEALTVKTLAPRPVDGGL